ncbi:hypothetical protein [Streptomyces sp. YKOK-J1]
MALTSAWTVDCPQLGEVCQQGSTSIKDRITAKKLAEEAVIDGETLHDIRSTWRDAAGPSFDIYGTEGTCLT